jgi:hypothetical protein
MRVADCRRDAYGERGEWDAVKVMRHMIRMTDEPTAICMFDETSEKPSLWFARNNNSEHPFFIVRLPKFQAVFLVADWHMWSIACEVNDISEDEYEVVGGSETTPFDVYNMNWENDTVEVHHERREQERRRNW